jgi:hypothetical protein
LNTNLLKRDFDGKNSLKRSIGRKEPVLEEKMQRSLEILNT